MNQEQVDHAIDAIDNFLKINYPNVVPESSMNKRWMLQEYAHLKYMVSKMRELAGYSPDDQETREKLMRWLGFTQGALWSLKHFTVNELRAMNTHGDL